MSAAAESTRVPTDDSDPVVATVSLAVLALGFVAMAVDLPSFWIIWAVGFGAVVPALAYLRRDGEVTDADAASQDGRDVDDALSTLRERYARGELSEAAFESKLTALLETETPEEARDRLRRERARDDPPTTEQEPNRRADTGSET
mgnify:FL=1